MVLGFVGVGGRHGKSNLKRRYPTPNAFIWDFFPCLTIFNHCTDSIAVITFFATVCQFGNRKLTFFPSAVFLLTPYLFSILTHSSANNLYFSHNSISFMFVVFPSFLNTVLQIQEFLQATVGIQANKASATSYVKTFS